MDNENNEFENMLREFTPKKPSHGARWNLDQRLADLEQADGTLPGTTRSPLVYAFFSAAATILVAFLIWAVALRPNSDTRPEIADTPSTPPGEAVVADANPDVPSPSSNEPEFIGDEKGVPSVITMKKHITDVQDAGVVHLPNRPPMRRVRQDYINEVQIRDPDTGKVYKVHKPGSETIYIKLDDY